MKAFKVLLIVCFFAFVPASASGQSPSPPTSPAPAPIKPITTGVPSVQTAQVAIRSRITSEILARKEAAQARLERFRVMERQLRQEQLRLMIEKLFLEQRIDNLHQIEEQMIDRSKNAAQATPSANLDRLREETAKVKGRLAIVNRRFDSTNAEQTFDALVDQVVITKLEMQKLDEYQRYVSSGYEGQLSPYTAQAVERAFPKTHPTILASSTLSLGASYALFAIALDIDVKSDVTIKTSRGAGATIKYKFQEGNSIGTVTGLTVCHDRWPIGLYEIWAERDNKRTSAINTYPIVAENVEVTIDENQ